MVFFTKVLTIFCTFNFLENKQSEGVVFRSDWGRSVGTKINLILRYTFYKHFHYPSWWVNFTASLSGA